jgi:hypothetical protein
MDSLDAITLKAFLAALMRLDASLPDNVQNQLNEIGQTFLANVPKLHALVKSYAPLEQEYMDARLALQKDGERFRSTIVERDRSTDIGEEKIINFAVEVLKAEDSVNLVQKKAQESSLLGQLLFQLRRQTSFMVENPHHSIEDIPEKERWLWQTPTAWASLERGLRQAQVGEVRDLGSFAQYADLEIED